MALYRCPSCGQVNYRYICDYCGVDCVPYGEISEEKEKPKKTEKSDSAHSTEKPVKQEKAGSVYGAEKPVKREKAGSVYGTEKPVKREKASSVYGAEKPELEHLRKIGIPSEKGRLPWEFKTAAIIMLCFGVIVLFCCIFERFGG